MHVCEPLAAIVTTETFIFQLVSQCHYLLQLTTHRILYYLIALAIYLLVKTLNRVHSDLSSVWSHHSCISLVKWCNSRNLCLLLPLTSHLNHSLTAHSNISLYLPRIKNSQSPISRPRKYKLISNFLKTSNSITMLKYLRNKYSPRSGQLLKKYRLPYICSQFRYRSDLKHLEFTQNLTYCYNRLTYFNLVRNWLSILFISFGVMFLKWWI